MAITRSLFHSLRILYQLQTNIVQLQRDIRSNAETWKAAATVQSSSAQQLKTWMQDAAVSYETRLEWLRSYRDTSPYWSDLATLYTLLGGNSTEVTTFYTEMKVVSDGLQAAGLNNYMQIINACDQIIAAIDAPDSLWPE